MTISARRCLATHGVMGTRVSALRIGECAPPFERPPGFPKSVSRSHCGGGHAMAVSVPHAPIDCAVLEDCR